MKLTFDGIMKMLFWHSMFMTITTPLFRRIYSTWVIVVTPTMDVVTHPDAPRDTYGYPTAAQADAAWIPHAFFGILWLIASYTQFVVTPFKKMHKIMGYFGCVVFLGHMCAALHSLYCDHMKHLLVNKVLLSLDLIQGVYHFHLAMRAIMKEKKNIARHKDHMFLAFIHSIEGAGTIRTINLIHWVLVKTRIAGGSWATPDFIATVTGAFLTQCQCQNGLVGRICAHAYAMRMLWTRFLSDTYLGLYAMIRGDEKLRKLVTRRRVVWLFNTVVFVIAGLEDLPIEAAAAVIVLANALTYVGVDVFEFLERSILAAIEELEFMRGSSIDAGDLNVKPMRAYSMRTTKDHITAERIKMMRAESRATLAELRRASTLSKMIFAAKSLSRMGTM